jgi:hypothetical protein
MKKSGFAQGIYEISSTCKERIGRLRVTDDGRKLRYARANSSAALAAGKLGVGAAISANVINFAPPAAAIGTKQLSLTLGGASTYAADYFKGGYLQVNDGTGEGSTYEIESSQAVSAGTSMVITLEDPIKVALTAAGSEVSLINSPWMAVQESTTLEIPCGVPLVAVTLSYYYWAQTGGLACVLMDGTPAAGSLVQQSNGTAGAMEVYAAGTITYPPVGIMQGTAGVDGEYKPVFLTID